MKNHSGWIRLLPVLTLLFTLFTAITAYGAEAEGEITGVYSDRITGWVWKKGTSEQTLSVELRIYMDGSEQPAITAVVSADSYSPDVSKLIGDGYHAFDYPTDLKSLGGNSYRVEAYVISGEKKLLFGEQVQVRASGLWTAPDKLSDSEEQALIDAKTGPGAKDLKKAEADKALDATGKYKKGESLGMYTTTGYCTCEICSGGSGRTYSGTIPKSRHTISADLNVLPLGTKVMIGDVVYTVEDKGSGVIGNSIDIYYGDHEEAIAHGRKTQEVFEVIEE